MSQDIEKNMIENTQQVINGLLAMQKVMLATCKIFACRENSITLTKVEEALMWQEKRMNELLD